MVGAAGALAGGKIGIPAVDNVLNAEYSGYIYYNGEPYQIHNGVSLEIKQHPADWYASSPNSKHGQFSFSEKLTDPTKEKELYFRREMVQDFQRTNPGVDPGDLLRLDQAQMRGAAKQLSKEAANFLR